MFDELNPCHTAQSSGSSGFPGSSADAGRCAGHVSAETPLPADALCSLSDEALERELATNAAHIAAAECRFCLMVAELDRRGIWAAQGAQSCAHWLSWRCGVGPAMAREHVRVGRALGQLPLVREAFSTGQLSYSKARAITRIATPAIEEALLQMAVLATAAQLERIVRSYRRASPDEGTAALACHRRRGLYSYCDEEGMVVIHARLSPEDGASVLAAIEATRHALAADGSGREEGERPERGEAPDPDAARVSAETPVEPFAASQADALVAICEATLTSDVASSSAYGPRASVIVHVDDQVFEDPTAEGCAHVEGVGVVSAHTVQRLACDARISTLRFRGDGAVVPEGKTRQVPDSMRRAVMTRDEGCRWPGCTRHRYVDVHHVTFVSRGGRTRLTNLVTLCRPHHRLVHEGAYGLTMDRHCVVRVIDPRGREIPVCPHVPTVRQTDLVAEHREDGLHFDDTTMPVGGGPCDMVLAVDALVGASAGLP